MKFENKISQKNKTIFYSVLNGYDSMSLQIKEKDKTDKIVITDTLNILKN